MAERPRALVTGANRGIGLFITRQLVEHGFHVHRMCRTPPEESLPESTIHYVDLSDEEAVLTLADQLQVPDVLVNNAGYMNPITALDYTEQKRREILQVNLITAVQLSIRIGARMAERGSGRVVSLGSIAGTIGHPDIWYGVTKAGLANAMRSLARSYGERGVTFNTVAPGPVETDMQRDNDPTRKARLRSLTFANRFGEPEEVARVVTWLATEAPLYLNGEVIDLNDGANFR